MNIVEDRIIFVISLPRSGSTFLQRTLSGHKDIYARGELWLLLNFFYMRKMGSNRADYGPNQLADVVQRFVDSSDSGEADFAELVREFYLGFFGKYIRSDKTWLVDKTPRYHLALDDLKKTFPNAKYVILYRDPLSVFGSYLNAMRANRLRHTDAFAIDLVDGASNIASFHKNYESEVCAIRYEDLVQDPHLELDRLFHYLGLSYDRRIVEDLPGQMMEGKGDSMQSRNYKGIVDRSKSWKAYIDSPLRKFVAKKFILQTDDSYLSMGKYDRAELLEELKSHRPSKLRAAELMYQAEEVIRRSSKLIYYTIKKHDIH